MSSSDGALPVFHWDESHSFFGLKIDNLHNYFSNYYIESFSNLIYGSVMKVIQMKSFSYLILPTF